MWLSGHKFNFRRQDMKIEWIVGKKLATFVANVMLNLNLSKIIEVVDVKKKNYLNSVTDITKYLSCRGPELWWWKRIP